MLLDYGNELFIGENEVINPVVAVTEFTLEEDERLIGFWSCGN